MSQLSNQNPAQAGSTPVKQPVKQAESSKAVLGAAISFIIWGILPIYWHWLAEINALEILAHRVWWSFVFLLLLMLYKKELFTTLQVLKCPKIFISVFCSAALLSFNWLIYIWAVTNDKIIDASFGYFITPLINVILGVVFFKDRPRRIQWLALSLAFTGVGHQFYAEGTVPWLGLGLAFSFGIYGMLRKRVALESLPGLFLESFILAIPCLIGLVYWQTQGEAAFFNTSLTNHFLLMFTSVVTSIPLLLFGFAARRIQLTTLGLLQYTTPTLAFLIGVFVYNELFTTNQAITFVCIWVALAIYTIDSLTHFRQSYVAAPPKTKSA